MSNFFYRTSVVFCFVLWGCIASLFPFSKPLYAQVKNPETYVLPENGNEIIFAYDLKNGFTPPRQNHAPALLIRSNGTIEMPSLYGEGRDIKGQLAPAELQAFLRFVINENKFLEFDTNTVQGQIDEIRQKRQVPQIADAPDTIIELLLPRHTHRVRQQAVGMPLQFKEVTSLQHLLAIRKGVNQLMSETRVGGKQGVKKLLGVINKQLEGEYPDVPPLKVEDFSGSYIKQDGSISATISRSGQDSDGKPNGTYITAIAVIPTGRGQPTVTLRVKLE